jgi:hypothetical protein
MSLGVLEPHKDFKPKQDDEEKRIMKIFISGGCFGYTI